MVGTVFVLLTALVVIVILLRSVLVVPAGETRQVYRLGQPHRVAGPGLHLLVPVIDATAAALGRSDPGTAARQPGVEQRWEGDLYPVERVGGDALHLRAVLRWHVADPARYVSDRSRWDLTARGAIGEALLDELGGTTGVVSDAEAAQVGRRIAPRIAGHLDEALGVRVLALELATRPPRAEQHPG
jgi:regulator of protease activity HflC (stomatin/prohibitin superfamily)